MKNTHGTTLWKKDGIKLNYKMVTIFAKLYSNKSLEENDRMFTEINSLDGFYFLTDVFRQTHRSLRFPFERPSAKGPGWRRRSLNSSSRKRP